MSFDAPLPRETGAERSGSFCPVCSTELPLVTSPFGSTNLGACPKCSVAEAASAQLEAQKAAAAATPVAPAPVAPVAPAPPVVAPASSDPVTE